MKIKRTIVHHNSNHPWPGIDVIDENFLPEEDQVRVGFQKGTLSKATFELNFGTTIVYELEE